jgi:NAD kinase
MSQEDFHKTFIDTTYIDERTQDIPPEVLKLAHRMMDLQERMQRIKVQPKRPYAPRDGPIPRRPQSPTLLYSGPELPEVFLQRQNTRPQPISTRTNHRITRKVKPAHIRSQIRQRKKLLQKKQAGLLPQDYEIAPVNEDLPSPVETQPVPIEDDYIPAVPRQRPPRPKPIHIGLKQLTLDPRDPNTFAQYREYFSPIQRHNMFLVRENPLGIISPHSLTFNPDNPGTILADLQCSRQAEAHTIYYPHPFEVSSSDDDEYLDPFFEDFDDRYIPQKYPLEGGIYTRSPYHEESKYSGQIMAFFSQQQQMFEHARLVAELIQVVGTLDHNDAATALAFLVHAAKSINFSINPQEMDPSEKFLDNLRRESRGEPHLPESPQPSGPLIAIGELLEKLHSIKPLAFPNPPKELPEPTLEEILKSEEEFVQNLRQQQKEKQGIIKKLQKQREAKLHQALIVALEEEEEEEKDGGKTGKSNLIDQASPIITTTANISVNTPPVVVTASTTNTDEGTKSEESGVVNEQKVTPVDNTANHDDHNEHEEDWEYYYSDDDDDDEDEQIVKVYPTLTTTDVRTDKSEKGTRIVTTIVTTHPPPPSPPSPPPHIIDNTTSNTQNTIIIAPNNEISSLTNPDQYPPSQFDNNVEGPDTVLPPPKEKIRKRRPKSQIKLIEPHEAFPPLSYTYYYQHPLIKRGKQHRLPSLDPGHPDFVRAGGSKLFLEKSPEAVLLIKKPGDGPQRLAAQMLIDFLHQHDIDVYCEPEVVKNREFKGILTMNTINPAAGIDLAITLGGDGTVLHLNDLFKSNSRSMPPILCFSLGTLGFLAPFPFSEYKTILAAMLRANSKYVYLCSRVRLQCAVFQRGEYGPRFCPPHIRSRRSKHHPHLDDDDGDNNGNGDGDDDNNNNYYNPNQAIKLSLPVNAEPPARKNNKTPIKRNYNNNLSNSVLSRNFQRVEFNDTDFVYGRAKSPAQIVQFNPLNEVVISRSLSSMASIQVFVDGHYVTTVAADGIIISTPTGSSGYSMSAGGPMMSPSAETLVLTPICPHNLSFRPLVLSSTSFIRLRVSDDMDPTTPLVASFDGRNQVELYPGDSVQVRVSNIKVPTVVFGEFNSDWFEAIKYKLYWNAQANDFKHLSFKSLTQRRRELQRQLRRLLHASAESTLLEEQNGPKQEILNHFFEQFKAPHPLYSDDDEYEYYDDDSDTEFDGFFLKNL